MGRKFFQTTEEQFNIFKDEVTEWLSFFGLLDVEVNICHEEIDDAGGAYGCTYGDVNNRTFNIALNKEMCDNGEGNFLTEMEIRTTAAHEVLEVLFMPLRDLARARGNWDEVDQHIHRLIRTIENTVIIPIISEELEDKAERNALSNRDRLKLDIGEIENEIDRLIIAQDEKEKALEELPEEEVAGEEEDIQLELPKGDSVEINVDIAEKLNSEMGKDIAERVTKAVLESLKGV